MMQIFKTPLVFIFIPQLYISLCWTLLYFYPEKYEIVKYMFLFLATVVIFVATYIFYLILKKNSSDGKLSTDIVKEIFVSGVWSDTKTTLRWETEQFLNDEWLYKYSIENSDLSGQGSPNLIYVIEVVTDFEINDAIKGTTPGLTISKSFLCDYIQNYPIQACMFSNSDGECVIVTKRKPTVGLVIVQSEDKKNIIAGYAMVPGK